MSFAVIPAPRDAVQFVKFLDHLQNANSHALGFLPFQALEQAITKGRVLLCYENDEPAGYVIHGPPKKHSKIYQTVIAEDSRRIEHGTALVEAVRMRMNRANAWTLSLHCAEDLPANSFWAAIGFEQIGGRHRRKNRDRWQKRYQEILPGKALAAIELRKQLEADGLTKLRALLTRGGLRTADLTFKRKQKTSHAIYLEEGEDAQEPINGTR